MIVPHRLINLHYCLINIAYAILKCLLERSEYSLDGLLKSCRADLKDTTKEDITNAVSFLFLLGVVDYDFNNDTVYLIEANND